MTPAAASGATDRSRDFDRLWQESLAPRMHELERLRRRGMFLGLPIAAVVLALGVWIIRRLLDLGATGEQMLLPALLVFVGTLFLGGLPFVPFLRAFRNEAVIPLIQTFDPRLEYRPFGKVPREDFIASGLFRDGPPGNYKGEDLCRATFGATAIRFSEVTADYRGEGNNEAGQLFKGLFLVADFNKHFSGTTYVLPDRAQKLLGGLGQSLQGMDSTYGQLVKLEDPEFERLFVVYSSDQVEARYILSSALMERISAFRIKTGQSLRIGFRHSTLYMAIPLRRGLFEPRWFRSVDNRELYRQFWDDLALFTGVVDDLSLNTRIWTKD